jgi:hypothetical protein
MRISNPNTIIQLAKESINHYVQYPWRECAPYSVEEKLADLDRLVKLCQTGQGDEIYELSEIYARLWSAFVISVKELLNMYIGWILPSRKAILRVLKAWTEHVKLFEDARIVDLGAGTGIGAYMFAHAGIPQDSIVALDLPVQTHRMDTQRSFWPIVHEYDIKPQDILFVGWGYGTDNVVEDYINRGGTCVIILGESGGGCTFPADHFQHGVDLDSATESKEYPGWTVVMTHVPGPASQYSECISVNTRYV